MANLYTSNFSNSTLYQLPAGFIGSGFAITDLVGGRKQLTQYADNQGWTKYTGVAAQTSVEYLFDIQAVVSIDTISLPYIGHGEFEGQWGSNSYRFHLAGTGSSLTADFTPFLANNFSGNLATGTRNVTVANGDVLRIRLKVVDKVVQLWMWNKTTETMPSSSLVTWTDTVQRPAGYFTIWNANAPLTGIENFVFNTVSSVATAITASGPSSGFTGVASSNFTVGLDANPTGNVVVTPSDGGAGGTFSPATLTLTSSVLTGVFTYTASTSGTKTISFTNNASLSNPTNLTYVSTSVSIIPVDNAQISWSPYNWDSLAIGDFGVSTVSKQTNNTGAYMRFKITGTTYIKIGVDSSMYTGILPADMPVIRYSVNKKPVQTVQLTQGVSSISLASGLTSGSSYTVDFWVTGFKNFGTLADRWGSAGVSPKFVVRVNGIHADNGATLQAWSPVRSKKAIIFGDSITEGFRSTGDFQPYNPLNTGKSIAWSIGDGMNAEYAVVGFSGQDFSAGDSVPYLTNSWNFLSAGRARSFAQAPDYVFSVMGSNNGNSPAAVSGWITAVRAALPSTNIFICVATSGVGASSMITGVANYKSANPSDAKVWLLDIRDVVPLAGMDSSVAPSMYADDGLHVNETGAAIWGAAAAGKAYNLMAAAGGSSIAPLYLAIGVDGVIITGAGGVMIPVN